MGLHNPLIQDDYDLFCYVGKAIDPKFIAPNHIKEVTLHCPAHIDNTASLSFTVKNGRALINCMAGCSFDKVLAACRLNTADLYLHDRNQDNSYRSRYERATQNERPKSIESMNNEADKEISLKGIDDSDTAERQAKRQSWAFSELTEEDYCSIRARYGFPVPVLKLLADNRILFKWHDTTQNPCWCLTDGSLESRYSAQAVRLDGEPFSQGNKKMTLPGSLTSYPIGWFLVVEAVQHLRFTLKHLNQCLFLVCEGVTDYLAAWCLAARFNMVFHFPMVLPLGILGAAIKPSAEIVETLTGCNVRLAFDDDDAGEDGQEVWKEALQEKCNLDAVDLHGKNDLRDLWNMIKPGEYPTSETVKMIKGELEYA